MRAALHAIRSGDHLVRLAPRLRAAGPTGVWTLAADGSARLDANGGHGPAILLVPSEQVLVMAVALPLPSRRQRLAALPFAIEDRIAEPIEAVHAALGIEAAPGSHLAAVVAPAVMARWIAQAEATGLGHAALLPDALALPVPEDGAWSVDRRGDRVLVRVPDATGFAVTTDRFGQYWASAGRPRCILYGDPLPDGVPGTALGDAVAGRLETPAIDLRQGRFARVRRGMSAHWRRAAIVVACGLAAHGLIATADTMALQRIAVARRLETRTIVDRIAPGTPTDGDLAEIAGDLLPSSQARAGAVVVPLIGRVSEALGAGVTLRSLAYDAAAGTLTLDIAAADLAGLQAVEGRMQAAGLDAASGGGAVAAGGAEGQIVVRTGRGAA